MGLVLLQMPANGKCMMTSELAAGLESGFGFEAAQLAELKIYTSNLYEEIQYGSSCCNRFLLLLLLLVSIVLHIVVLCLLHSIAVLYFICHMRYGQLIVLLIQLYTTRTKRRRAHTHIFTHSFIYTTHLLALLHIFFGARVCCFGRLYPLWQSIYARLSAFYAQTLAYSSKRFSITLQFLCTHTHTHICSIIQSCNEFDCSNVFFIADFISISASTIYDNNKIVFSISLVLFYSRNMQKNNNKKLSLYYRQTQDSIVFKMLLLLAIFLCCAPSLVASSLDGLQGQSIKGKLISVTLKTYSFDL